MLSHIEHLIPRMQDSIQSRSLEQSETLPAFLYTDPAMHAMDEEHVIARSWQYVGHINQLKKVGDVIVTEIGQRPIMVVRNSEQQIKAFYNVCKHRAGPIALKNGNMKQLRCKYHGWTYQLDGQLRAAPEMQETPNFNVCDVHLDEVQFEVWQGLIFVALKPNTIALSELFGELADTLEPVDLTQMEFHHRDEYLIQCNWKVYMDNYLEGYHLPHVHPGLNRLLNYKDYKTLLFDWYSYQYSPLENANNFYGSGQAHYVCAYPNLMLNILPGRCQVNLVVPVSHQQCKVIFDYYYSDIDSTETLKMIEDDLSFSDEVQDEDIEICEHVQKGLNSGIYDVGRLCVKREQGVWHFQEMLRKAYRNMLQLE